MKQPGRSFLAATRWMRKYGTVYQLRFMFTPVRCQSLPAGSSQLAPPSWLCAIVAGGSGHGSHTFQQGFDGAGASAQVEARIRGAGNGANDLGSTVACAGLCCSCPCSVPVLNVSQTPHRLCNR